MAVDADVIEVLEEATREDTVEVLDVVADVEMTVKTVVSRITVILVVRI